MAETIILKGRALAPGVVEGEALVSKESLVWSHGVNPPTGKIVDVRVAVCGECVKDKVLVYPLGKGSTASATWILENTRCGNAPKGVVHRAVRRYHSRRGPSGPGPDLGDRVRRLGEGGRRPRDCGSDKEKIIRRDGQQIKIDITTERKRKL